MSKVQVRKPQISKVPGASPVKKTTAVRGGGKRTTPKINYTRK